MHGASVSSSLLNSVLPLLLTPHVTLETSMIESFHGQSGRDTLGELVRLGIRLGGVFLSIVQILTITKACGTPEAKKEIKSCYH